MGNHNRSKLYLAAPLFSEPERAFNRELRAALSGWFDVFLPQEDGALVLELIENGMPIEQAKMTIFKNDVQAVKGADKLLIVMDGRAIDEGAAFELGLAFALGKECWGLKTDIRQLLPIGDNPMIECSVSVVFRSVGELVEHAKLEFSRSAEGRSGNPRGH